MGTSLNYTCLWKTSGRTALHLRLRMAWNPVLSGQDYGSWFGVHILHWWRKETGTNLYRIRLLLFITKSCPTHCPFLFWPHGLQPARFLSVGFSRQEYWSGLPFPSPGDFPLPRDQTHISCIGRQILSHWATREALQKKMKYVKWTQKLHAGETRTGRRKRGLILTEEELRVVR